MTDRINDVHWSFWLIAGLTLLYNLAGVMNFIMQLDTTNVAAMPEGYRIIIETRPLWATVAFALAVFGGALGCVLLLLRRSLAGPVFIASLIGAVITMIHSASTDSPPEFLMGNLMQMIVTAFLIWYTRWSTGKGWLH